MFAVALSTNMYGMQLYIGENLECERETSNKKDRYTVIAKKAETIIGHLPKKISWICSLFLLRRERIVATVTGRQDFLLI